MIVAEIVTLCCLVATAFFLGRAHRNIVQAQRNMDETRRLLRERERP